MKVILITKIKPGGTLINIEVCLDNVPSKGDTIYLGDDFEIEGDFEVKNVEWVLSKEKTHHVNLFVTKTASPGA